MKRTWVELRGLSSVRNSHASSNARPDWLAALAAVVLALGLWVAGGGTAQADPLRVGSVTQLSVTADGSEPNNFSSGPVMSANGRYVAFTTLASNLAITGMIGAGGIGASVLWDRQTQSLQMVAGGAPIAFSDDGRFFLAGVVANSNSGGVTDLQTGETIAIPTDNQPASPQSMSGDGSEIAYLKNNSAGVQTSYLYSPITGVTTAMPDDSTAPRLSGDGRYLFYVIRSTLRGYRYDIATGQTVEIGSGDYAVGDNPAPFISHDGNIAVFHGYRFSDFSGLWFVERMDTGVVSSFDLPAESTPGSLSADGNLLSYYQHITGTTIANTVVRDMTAGTDLVVSTGSYKRATSQPSEDGSSIAYAALDPTGAETEVYVAALGTSVDTTPPIVTGILSPQPNAAGWNNSSVQVSWSASDPDSPATTPTPATVSGEGAQQAVASDQSCDPSGNCASGWATVSIDETPPTISGEIVDADGAPRPAGPGGWYDSAVQVHWTCSDALSGVATCPADSYLSQDGAGQAVAASSTDIADNAASASVTGINIDATAPVSVATTACGTSTYCAGSTVQVNLSATDSGSGVASLHVKVDGGSQTDFSGAAATLSVPLGSNSGSKTITYWATDLAGNTEGVNTAVVKYDNVAPVITHALSPAPNAAGWSNANTTIHWSASDDNGGSGIASVTPDVIISSETTGIIKVGTAVDNAGNASTDSVTVKLDKTPPTISGTATGTKNAQGYYTGLVTVHFTCSDSGSGLVSCPSDTIMSHAGADQSVTGTAVDAASNTTSYVVSGITIVPQPPTVAVTTPGNSKLRSGDQVTGTISSAAGITSVVVTYTPNGNGRSPENVAATVTTGTTTNGVTSYSWAARPPTSFNGRASFVVTITDIYGQVSSSSPVSIVVN